MPTELNVGIIGVHPERGWARESHVPAVQSLPGLKLVAVANRRQGTADAAASAFGVEKAYGDAGAMVRDPDVDLVTVAATLPAHDELVLGAIEAGKHIFCEYPLGLDSAQSRRLADAAKASGVHVAIGLQFRGSPAVRAASEMIAAGRIGRPLSARVYSTTMAFGPNPAGADAYTEDPRNAVNLVTIQTAHTVDLVIAMLGGFSDLSALLTRQFPNIRIDGGEPQPRTTYDHVLVQGRLEGGASAAVEVAGGRPLDTPFLLEIVGEAGALRVEGAAPRGAQAGRLRLMVDGEPEPVGDGETGGLPHGAVNVAGLYAALRDDIAGDTRTVVDFEHAVRLALLTEDVAASSQAGARKPSRDWPRH